MPVRRFPPPWTAEVTPNCFIVRDADGGSLPMFIMRASLVAAQRQSFSARTRRGGLPATSPSCRSYCGSPELLSRNRRRGRHPHRGHHRFSALHLYDGESGLNVIDCFENPCSNKYEQTSSFPNGV